jgi:hypothetical protein
MKNLLESHEDTGTREWPIGVVSLGNVQPGAVCCIEARVAAACRLVGVEPNPAVATDFVV